MTFFVLSHDCVVSFLFHDLLGMLLQYRLVYCIVHVVIYFSNLYIILSYDVLVYF